MARSFVRTSSQFLEKTAVSPFPVTAYPFTLFGRGQVTTVVAGNKELLIISLVDTVDTTSYLELGFLHNSVGDVLTGNMTIRNGSSFNIESSALVQGQIYNLVGVFTSATDREFFIDGVSIGTDTNSAALPTSLDVISVGRTGRASPFGYFDGDIIEAGISDVAWTLNDAIAYGAGVQASQIKPNNIVSYWPLWNGQSPEPDLGTAANGDDLTLTAGPTFLNQSIGGRYAPFKSQNQDVAVKRQEVEHIYYRILGAPTVASSTWATKGRIGNGAFTPNSTWWLFVRGAISTDNVTNRTRIQLLQGGDVILGSLMELNHKTANFTDGTDYAFSKVIRFGETPETIELQMANSSTSTTRMQAGTMFMMRLDRDFQENKDWWYRDNVTLNPLIADFGDPAITQEDIPPPADLLGTDEKLMFVATVTMDAEAQLDNLRKPIQQIIIPGGGNRNRTWINRNNNEERVCTSGGVLDAALLEADASLALQRLAVNNSTSPSVHRWSSLFVMRKNIFNQARFVDGGAPQINTGTGLEQLLDLSLTPNEVGNFMAFGFAACGYEAGSTAGLRNGLLAFRNGGVLEPTDADAVRGCDAEELAEENPLAQIAYFKDLPTTVQSIELMAQGNEANDVNFNTYSALVFSLLPSRHFKVAGVVLESGSPVSRTVRAFLKSTGEFLGEVQSFADTGAYEICGLPGGTVFVVAFDDDGGQSFNAQVFDKVTPVIPT